MCQLTYKMRKKILIAATDQNITAIISYLVDKAGYEPITANSAGVFQQLEDISPDIILLDERLDNDKGKELCRKLKEHPLTAQYKIVLLSAETDIQKVIFESCADKIIPRPFHIDNLLQILPFLL